MPSTVTLDQHENISQLAYELWEQEGRPDDRAELHWFQAEAIVSSKNVAKKPAKKLSPRSRQRKA